MSPSARPDRPPHPPADFAERPLEIVCVGEDVILNRIHRSRHPPFHFDCADDPERRKRWDAPDGSYGVCDMAERGHIAFAETLLRDLVLDAIPKAELEVHSLARFRVRTPLRLATMHGQGLRAHGADASVVQGPYSITRAWSAAFHAHPAVPDGIRCRARHDDSGFSIALFDRARQKVEHTGSVELLEPLFTAELTRWLDRYGVGLTS